MAKLKTSIQKPAQVYPDYENKQQKNWAQPGEPVLKEEINATNFSFGKRHSGLITFLVEKEKRSHCSADLERARNQDMKSSVGILVQHVTATIVILSFVGLLFCVLYRENDLANKDIFNILLGILGTVVVQIFQYWFGASASTPGSSKRISRKS